jgi:hypothetical protein
VSIDPFDTSRASLTQRRLLNAAEDVLMAFHSTPAAPFSLTNPVLIVLPWKVA